MDSIFSTGGLLPLWILGAGLLSGVLELIRTPSPSHHSQSSTVRTGSDASYASTGQRAAA